MGRRRKTALEKAPKRKAVKISIIPPRHAGRETEPYQFMHERIESCRKDLSDVKIGLAWHAGWRPDADGVRTHGKAIKRTDLDRSLDGFDAIIELNRQSWQAFDEKAKRRLIAHELEHIQVTRDRNGEVLLDDKNRVVIRIRKHNIADFDNIIREFGVAMMPTETEIADADRPLLKLGESKPTPAADPVPFEEDPAPADPAAAAPVPAPASADGVIRIRVKSKKIGLDATIALQFRGDGWRMGYAIDAGHKTAALALDTATVVYPTSAAAAAGGAKELVAWLQVLYTKEEYAYAGTAQARLKQAVARWIKGRPDAEA